MSQGCVLSTCTYDSTNYKYLVDFLDDANASERLMTFQFYIGTEYYFVKNFGESNWKEDIIGFHEKRCLFLVFCLSFFVFLFFFLSSSLRSQVHSNDL